MTDPLTITEAAALRGVHPNSVTRAIKEGRLPAQKDERGCWQIRRCDAEGWNIVGHRPKKVRRNVAWREQ